MTHIRDVHKEKKEPCKYFKQGRCNFSAKNCWSSHEENEGNRISSNKEDIKCFSCPMTFSTKPAMLKHRKLKHIEEVKECSKYQSGECGFSDTYCWNKHTAKLNNHIKKSHKQNVPLSTEDFREFPQNQDPPENLN